MVSGRSAKSVFEQRLSGVYPRLWRYCLVLTKHHSDAEDLAQRVTLQAIEKSATYRDYGKMDRWLFRIAQRMWLNEIRARAVRTGTGLRPVEDCDLQDEKPTAEANIFLAEVLSGIMTLPEEQRVTLLLVYAEGLSYKEAAETLEIPMGTIMSRLAAARKKLNQMFSEDQNE